MKLNRHMLFSFLSACLVLCSFSVAAETDEQGVVKHYPFQSSDKAALFHQLTKEIRCPKCQNQNIADSNAGVAVDLKNKTYQLVKEGKNKSEVIDYMKQRYGDFIHYQPPINWLTIWLWLVPILLTLGLLKGVSKAQQQTAKADDMTTQTDLIKQAELILNNKSVKPNSQENT